MQSLAASAPARRAEPTRPPLQIAICSQEARRTACQFCARKSGLHAFGKLAPASLARATIPAYGPRQRPAREWRRTQGRDMSKHPFKLGSRLLFGRRIPRRPRGLQRQQARQAGRTGRRRSPRPSDDAAWPAAAVADPATARLHRRRPRRPRCAPWPNRSPTTTSPAWSHPRQGRRHRRSSRPTASSRATRRPARR